MTRIDLAFRIVAPPFAAAVLLVACGGGGSSSPPVFRSTPTPVPTVSPTPRVSPTPFPISSTNLSSGSQAPCVLVASGTTYAFVPGTSSSGSQELAEVAIATGSSLVVKRNVPSRRWFAHVAEGRTVETASAVSPLLALARPPTECASDPANATLYAISDGRLLSDGSNVMSPLVMPVAVGGSGGLSAGAPFTTDATTPIQWSGGDEVDISGIAYDPVDGAVVIDGAAGYETYSTGGTKLSQHLSGCPAANFGYDTPYDRIWSPTYDQACGSALLTGDLANQTALLTLNPEPPNLEIPDSGAVDAGTGLAVAPEQGPPYVHLVSLASAKYDSSGGTFSAPSATVDLTVNSVQSYIPEVAVDAATHLAFFTGAYRATDLCVASLSAGGSGAPGVGDYAYANFPNTADSNAFEEPYEPRAVATFDLGSEAYGLTFNVQDSYVAVVDLQKLLAAPRSPHDPHAVLPSYNLLTNGVVTYIPI